jgi:hypothetical protein
LGRCATGQAGEGDDGEISGYFFYGRVTHGSSVCHKCTLIEFISVTFGCPWHGFFTFTQKQKIWKH